MTSWEQHEYSSESSSATANFEDDLMQVSGKSREDVQEFMNSCREFIANRKRMFVAAILRRYYSKKQWTPL